MNSINHQILVFSLVWLTLIGVTCISDDSDGALAAPLAAPLATPIQVDQERDFSGINGRMERNRTSRFDELDQDSAIRDRLMRVDDQPLIGRLEGSKLHLDIGATVHFIDDVMLAARESGQIVELDIREGDAFTAKQLLGRQDDSLLRLAQSQAKLRYDIALEKATDRTSLLAAKKREDLAKTKYQRTKSLTDRGSAAPNELEVAQYEYELAILGVQAAQNEQKQAEAEMRLEEERMQEALERINRHQLFVDFNGYVIEVIKQKFEWANAGDPVLRVARMDRLEIHALVSSELVNPHQIVKGQQIAVTLTLANRQTEQFTGTISSIPLMREGSDVFRIKAEEKVFG